MNCQRLKPSTNEKQTTSVGSPASSTSYGERSTCPCTPGAVSKRRCGRRTAFGRMTPAYSFRML